VSNKLSKPVSIRTHCDRLLVMLLATDQMRNLGGDLRRKGTAVGLYPLSHLVVRARLAKISGDCNCETLERVLHVGR